MKPEQVAEGLLLFAETEMLPTLEGWQLFAGSALLVLAAQRTNVILSSLLENEAAKALGLVTEKGGIDVDAAINALKEAARKHGALEVDLQIFGKYKFSEGDFDTLYQYIAGTGKK